jgi:hypothetical protein
MLLRSTFAKRALGAGAALASTLAPAAAGAQQAAPTSPSVALQQPSATAPGYGAAQPGHGAAPPGYGAAPPGYGAAPPGYGVAPPGYGGYMQTLPPDTEPQSFGMIVSGALLLSFGVTGILAGSSMVIAATRTPEIVPCFPGAECAPTRADHSALEAVGVTTLVISSLATIGGIPLLVIGAKKVPARTETTALRPEVRVGPTGGALRWHF